METLLLPVDIYCERLGVGFWAEPFNALSNLAFPVAALIGWRTKQRLGIYSTALSVLIVMAGLIGLGSFLFHTFANGWSEYADTIPIWSFVAFAVYLSIRQIGGVKPGRIVMIGLGVAAILVVVLLATGEGSTPAAAREPDPLNGSGQYAPALAALLVFSYVGWRRNSPLRGWIWAATATFCASLIFRTIDMVLCPVWPMGTHFMWHLLNGLMIGLLLQLLLRAQRTPTR